jgi:hypothetical protein
MWFRKKSPREKATYAMRDAVYALDEAVDHLMRAGDNELADRLSKYSGLTCVVMQKNAMAFGLEIQNDAQAVT